MEHECSICSSIWWKAVWAEGRENGAGGQESLGWNSIWYLSRPSESLSGAQGLHRSICKMGQQSHSLGLLHPFSCWSGCCVILPGHHWGHPILYFQPWLVFLHTWLVGLSSSSDHCFVFPLSVWDTTIQSHYSPDPRIPITLPSHCLPIR